jgi:hypothetical protein
MIYYNPTDSDIFQKWVKYSPRTCFLMTQLGGQRSKELNTIIKDLENHLFKAKFKVVDANSFVTGKDFLDKIWKISLSVPVGIAVVTETMRNTTISNIFYEIGLLTALGKETLIIKSKNFEMPSDFVRTEYIEYDDSFDSKIKNFIEHLEEQGDYYNIMAENLHSKPVVSLDYYRRSYLLNGDESIKESAKKVFEKEHFDEHTNMMMNSFLKNKQ